VHILSRFSELELLLEPVRAELVRAFVREASLADGGGASVSSLIADDAAQAWLALCTATSGRERARIVLSCTCGEVRTKILLNGHSRFSHIVTTLASCIRPEAGIACHEHGIDGWEVSLHRSLTGQGEPRLFAREEPSSTPATAAAGEYVIDLPQQDDAAAIARCFLAVYGHHYIHSDVFSPRRYWEQVERGELIPVVARDEEGDVIGHVALERESGAVVAERGEAVVLPAYRGHHLLERMTERLSEQASKQGLLGIYADRLRFIPFLSATTSEPGCQSALCCSAPILRVSDPRVETARPLGSDRAISAPSASCSRPSHA
jgi:hypothetical protein